MYITRCRECHNLNCKSHGTCTAIKLSYFRNNVTVKLFESSALLIMLIMLIMLDVCYDITKMK